MIDKRNASYPPSESYDNCSHEWESKIDDMMEGAVECKKCGVPGQKDNDENVYWPAT